MIFAIQNNISNSGFLGFVVADSFKEAATKLELKIEKEVSSGGILSYCILEQGFELVRTREKEITSLASLLDAKEKSTRIQKRRERT